MRARVVTFHYTVLGITDERYATLKLVTYVPVAGTGTRELLEELVGAVAAS